MKKKYLIPLCAALLVIVGYFSLKTYASSVAKEKIDAEIAKNANFVDIHYKNVDAGIFGDSIRISEVSIHPIGIKEKFKIHEIFIKDFDKNEQIPSYMSLSIRGMEYGIQHAGDYASEMKNLGYGDTLFLNIHLDYRYEKEKRKLEIKNFAIGADNVGDIKIAFHVEDINLDAKETFNLMFTYPQIMFHQAKIEYTDKSFVERALQMEAKERQMDVQELRKEIIQEMEKNIAQAQDDHAKKAWTAFKKFMEDPKTLALSASPEKPQPLGRILRATSFEEIVNLLNIRIES